MPIPELGQLDQVQLRWDEFMYHLDSMFQEAISTLIKKKQLSFQEGQNRTKGSISKGSAPIHVTTFGSKKGFTRGQGSMMILKLRKKLARLYQINRILCCTHGWRNHEEEVRGLTNKLGFGEPSAGLLPVIHSQIKETKELLSSQVQDTRKVRLKTWKENLRRNPGAMGRWIKAFDTPKVHEVTNGIETSADNHKVVHFIKEFWNSFWEEGNQLRSDSMLDTLVQHAFVPNESINWQSPSLELLVQTARTRQSGSAGPDGWAAEEIRHLPEQAFAHFRALAIGWETKGVVPHQLLTSRMVNLPKLKNSSGPLMVDQIRPITILNCFWRLWASAWIQTDGATTWVDRLPPEIVFGTGTDAQIAASEIFNEVVVKKFGASLDFTKCYDAMECRGTAHLLLHGGWPRGIVRVLQQVWSGQCRWVSWAGHTSRGIVRLKVVRSGHWLWRPGWLLEFGLCKA